MIKYNNKTINEWYFDSKNIIKVYKNNAVCYYKIVSGGGTPSQEPCFAVVNNISSYQDREFIDVYDKATDKWYKLNNLSQYEQYGIYGDGRNITYYVGKLTIDEGYEYEWNGTSWVNLGEVSGSSIIIHSPEYLERSSSSNGYLPLGETFQLNTTIEMDFQMTQAKGNTIIGDYGTNDSNDWRLFLNYDTRVNNLLSYDFISTRAQYNTGNWAKRFNIRIGNYYVDDIDTGTRLINSTRKTSFTRPNQMYLFHMQGSQITNNTDYGHIYSVKIYQDGTLVKDYIPWTDGNGTYGMWDKVSNQSVTSVGQMTGSSVVHDIDVGDEPVYPKYYTEKDEPENNVVFANMEEALAYECPWVGMNVTIDNTPYLFGESYEWLTKYGLFEVSGEFVCDDGDKYMKMEEMVRNLDGSWSHQSPAVYEIGDLIEADSDDCKGDVIIEWLECGNGSSRGGLQLLQNVTTDFFYVVDVQNTTTSFSGDYTVMGQKSSVEAVSYQMGFMFYSSNMFLDYGGGRLNTNINPTTQQERHTYSVGHNTPSNPEKIVILMDGVQKATANYASRVEDLPYLMGGVQYTGHTSSDVALSNSTNKKVKIWSVKVYTDCGQTLVGDYIPVRKQDGTVTLYDKISGGYANTYGKITGSEI